MKMRSAMCIFIAAFLVSAFVFLVSSERIVSSAPLDPTVAKTWNGGIEGYWNVAGNWSPPGIPDAGDDVTIGAGNTVTFTGGTSTIQSIHCDGSLIISSGSFTVVNASTLNYLEVNGASAFFNGATTVKTLWLWGNATTEAVLGGTGTMTITDEFRWYGANPYNPAHLKNSRISGPGKTIIAVAEMNPSVIGGISAHVLPVLGGTSAGTGRILEISGHLHQNDCLKLANGSIIDIKPGALVEHGGSCWIENAGGSIINAGTFRMISAFTIHTPMTNTGLIDVVDPAIAEQYFYGLANSGTIRGVPGIEITLGGYQTLPLNFSSSSIVTVTQGTVSFGSGLWNIQGTYNVGTTRLDFQADTITITSSSNPQIPNLEIWSGKLVSEKSIALNKLTIGKKYEEYQSLLSGSGNLTINERFNWNGGTMEGPGSTTVNGQLNITNPELKTLGTPGKNRSLFANGTGSWSNGNIDASSGSTFAIQSGHSLTAKGILTGTLTNNGTLGVGGSVGKLKVTGGYTQGATGLLKMELGGNNPGDYDLLEVGGLATLAGTLSVTEISPYSLVGNNLDILTYGARSGSFNTLNLPSGGQVTYNTHALNVSSAGSAPTSVSIHGPSNGTINHSYIFTTTVLPVGVSPAPSYVWSPTPDNGQGTTSATFSWPITGNKTISVTASNTLGSVTDTHEIYIVDTAISSLVAINDSPHLLGETTALTATISGGTNVTYRWNFGDGSPAANGANQSHDYTGVGTYTGVVTATNTAGGVVTSTQVTIWGTIPTSGGTIYPASNVTVTLPGGAITDTIVLQFELQPNMTVPGMSDVGVFYELGPVYQSNGLPANLVSGTTYTITVCYREEDIPTGTDESDLALHYWDGSAWVKESSSLVDVLANTITATPNHFSQWGIMTPSTQYLYLPFVRRQ